MKRTNNLYIIRYEVVFTSIGPKEFYTVVEGPEAPGPLNSESMSIYEEVVRRFLHEGPKDRHPVTVTGIALVHRIEQLDTPTQLRNGNELLTVKAKWVTKPTLSITFDNSWTTK